MFCYRLWWKCLLKGPDLVIWYMLHDCLQHFHFIKCTGDHFLLLPDFKLLFLKTILKSLRYEISYIAPRWCWHKNFSLLLSLFFSNSFIITLMAIFIAFLDILKETKPYLRINSVLLFTQYYLLTTVNNWICS